MMAMRGCFGRDGFLRGRRLTAIEAQSQETEASKRARAGARPYRLSPNLGRIGLTLRQLNEWRLASARPEES